MDAGLDAVGATGGNESMVGKGRIECEGMWKFAYIVIPTASKGAFASAIYMLIVFSVEILHLEATPSTGSSRIVG